MTDTYGLRDSQDFEGQRKAERYAQLFVISSAVLGFLLGLILQDLRVTFGMFGSGFLGALLVSSHSRLRSVALPTQLFADCRSAVADVHPKSHRMAPRIDLAGRRDQESAMTAVDLLDR